jgi:hypothetical protein
VSTLAETDNKNESHFVLLNKITGKVASTNNWLLALATNAHCIGDTSGIAGLLPQDQAKKLLVSNELSIKVARRAKCGRLTDNISNQAITLLPQLAVLFVEQHAIHKTITLENFCKWVAKQLTDETSNAYHNAVYRGFEDLIKATAPPDTHTDTNNRYKPRSARWWQDQIKKCRVKDRISYISYKNAEQIS